MTSTTGNIIEALGYTPADVDDLNALDNSVVKHTEQTLTSTQQAQARTNIAAASSSELNALSTTVSGKQDALTFDTTPTANSTNPVTSQGILTALNTLSDAQSDALTAGLATKQATLTFDATPTANSSNPVTSDGIKTALNTLSDAQLQALTAITDVGNSIPPVESTQDSGTVAVEQNRLVTVTGTQSALTLSGLPSGGLMRETAIFFSASAGWTLTLGSSDYKVVNKNMVGIAGDFVAVIFGKAVAIGRRESP